MTSTRHDELVEEIPEELQFKVGQQVLRLIDARRDAAWVIAGKIINLVAKAVVDGMPLPGEEGRWNLGSIYDEPEGTWLKEWLNEMLLKKDAFEFIALSPTGTGEEEPND